MTERPTADPAVPPIVSFRSVTKRYDPKSTVVDDLSLDIVKGEFLTLLGPSGSGKTTTLMMLAGFEWPSSGRIFMDGQDITDLPPHKRDLGVVFQSYALFPHMSVADNVAFPLAVRNVSAEEKKRRVAEALELVHLSGFGDRKPGQLSGGQQQRVALARSLVYRPRIVLMDEPLGALDKALREQMQLEIKQIHRQLGVTFVYVTHDQDEALTMSDRVAVFHEGRIQQICSPVEIYRRPRTRFVASFLGETNMLPGTVVGADGAMAEIKLANGVVLRGLAGEGIAAGKEAVLVVRPEAIPEIHAADAGGNAIEGTLLDQLFHGDHVRVRITVAGGQTVQLKLRPQACSGLPAAGETLRLSIPVEEALILA
ncbi:ABC transporter ATP-binding protein [Mesorhizobium sp. CU2]|uniref:ABC transporter ATP-binding protein n=1 Tax=unclassified Mesorhizobium TaxID=325217 RepID=UPI001129796A|nr:MULTISPECIES: ABC transporter ATP-binding protein [unclassified Mesorhizobium]TPN85600.1 ABC transporter ATP-binding protein [Mesorhizobium sp. CU3]TPO10278.1 ABC transporter ATP-binding protein [Mesorhizobium sp. CU2]